MRLNAGERAPSFTLPSADGSQVSLEDFAGRKVVVYVYPAAATPGCTVQANDFQASQQQLADAGYAVLGISPDPPEKLASFAAAEGLTFPLLSDPSRETLLTYGAFGEKQLYGKTVTGVIRSTFVVDEQGALASASYNVRAKGHVAKLVRDLGLS